MKTIFLLILTLILQPVTVSAQLFSKKADAKISLQPQLTFQTIENLSGNYCQANYKDKAEDAVGQFTLNRFKPTNVRFAIPIRQWEPQNDNKSASEVYWPGFKDTGVTESLFRMLKTMKNRHGVKTFTGSIWDLPDWMVANPEEREKRKVKPEMYAEVAESIGTFLRHAKGKYGVEINYISFNEADGGYQIQFSAQEMIAFIKVAVPIIEKIGVSVKFLTGDVHRTDATVPYVSELLADESIRKYLGPISFHSWWSNTLSETAFEKIADLGKQYNLPIWCTEVGYNAFLWKTPEAHPTWLNAWEIAKIYHRVLRYSGAVVTHYWTFQDNFPLVSADTLTTYPIFQYTERLIKHFKPGTVIIDATTNDPDLWVLAGKDPKGKLFMQVLNISDWSKEVEIDNWKAKEATAALSSAAASSFDTQIIKVKSDKFRINLPPRSIAFLAMS
jgi:O-glycosyl hydrolase